MALGKTIETDIGVDATYHKIMSLNWGGDVSEADESVRFCTVVVGSYIDEAAREGGMKPYKQKEYKVEIDLSSQKNWIKQAYEYLVELDEFSGSESI